MSIQLAFHTLKLNLSRSLLTILGITVGISMVVIVLSAGSGLKGIILDQISGFGNNWINIEVKVPDTGKNSQENGNAQASGVVITTLNEKDMEALKKLPDITNAYAGLVSQAVISYGDQVKRSMIFAVSASYPDINKGALEQGRFFSEDENRAVSNVVVLGTGVAQDLFGEISPVGKLVRIDKSNYEVVGVMEKLGNGGFLDMDQIMYVPVRTVQKKVMGIDHVSWIVAEAQEGSNSIALAEEIRAVMRERHKITDPNKDDFAVTTQEEAAAIVGTILVGITGLLIALSCISLIVGGVGIMNVMYVSVAERTFEIGLRKSAGATTSDILWQFLVEAVVLTIFGGVLGVLIGVSISFLISVIANLIGFAWEFDISLFSLILSTGFSTAVGILFGLYPAKKAASLDPMVAIRQE